MISGMKFSGQMGSLELMVRGSPLVISFGFKVIFALKNNSMGSYLVVLFDG